MNKEFINFYEQWLPQPFDVRTEVFYDLDLDDDTLDEIVLALEDKFSMIFTFNYRDHLPSPYFSLFSKNNWWDNPITNKLKRRWYKSLTLGDLWQEANSK